MKHYNTDLADHIADQMEALCRSLGVTPEEWIRRLVGEEIIASNPKPDSGISADFDTRANMLDFIRGMASVNGQLKCSQCLQPLSLADVDRKSCGRCEAPVE